MLQGLIDKADARIAEIRSGEKPALTPDENATYFAEVVVDLDQIVEPMIADPDVNNADVSKRYTHDTIRPVSYYGGDKKVDLGFVGSCMVHKGDMKIVAQMLKNLEKEAGTVEFKAPLVVAAPTYNIIDELKAEGDWEILQKYSGFEFDDFMPKTEARTEYENILYLERPGCNLCMGNQEKAAKGDTVLATSTRLFPGPRRRRCTGEKGRVAACLDPGCRPFRDPWAHAQRRGVQDRGRRHRSDQIRAAAGHPGNVEIGAFLRPGRILSTAQALPKSVSDALVNS